MVVPHCPTHSHATKCASNYESEIYLLKKTTYGTIEGMSFMFLTAFVPVCTLGTPVNSSSKKSSIHTDNIDSVFIYIYIYIYTVYIYIQYIYI